MHTGLERILTLNFGSGGNETNHLGNGWSGEEPGNRWMVGQGSELWLEHPGPDHDLILDMTIGTMRLPEGSAPQRLVVGARNRGVAQIGVTHGGGIGFHIPAALIAAPGPVRVLFIHPDFRRPMDFEGGTDDRQLAFSVQSLRVSRILPRPTLPAAAALPPDQLIMRFESLGDNCEFGLVQRMMGAEPLGLLRFSFIELRQLLRGLRCGFDGLGDPSTTEVGAFGPDREIVVKESLYGMTYHTYQYESQIDLDTVHRQQVTRLNFLARKLLEDVGNGEKIFVLKRTPPLRPEEVLPIYAALNELGRNWLLWMLTSDAAHPPGTVEVLLPGLLRGYIDRFAPGENAHDLSLAAWRSVCEAAWRAVGGALTA
jgi:hypothetical protein